MKLNETDRVHDMKRNENKCCLNGGEGTCDIRNDVVIILNGK